MGGAVCARSARTRDARTRARNAAGSRLTAVALAAGDVGQGAVRKRWPVRSEYRLWMLAQCPK
eukprot:6185631-Pleurochrysis_carterae.AAC.1